MNRCRIGRGLVSGLALAAIIASCGGSDSDSENGAAPGSIATESTDDVATTDDSTDGAATTDVAITADASDDSTDGESDDADGGGATPNCDAIFSMDEVEEFFAEPVELTEETNDSLGQLVCYWESIEDPDDTEDLAFKTLIVQVYSGSPIDASAFIDPSIYDSVTMIEGIGDLAYSTSEVLGTDYFFYDDPVGGSLSYAEVDMGDADAPKLHTAEDVEQLFRTFHDRVT